MTLPKRLLVEYKSLQMNENELAIILHIYRLQMEGIRLPSIQAVSQFTTLKEQEVAQALRSIMKKGLLVIEQQKEDNVIHEWYSLEPLWKLLYNGETSVEEKDNDSNLFILFEQEFGRALSPIEIETINHWLDDDELSPALIKAALREAVLMAKLNFRYVDRILNEWHKKGVKTVEDARKVSQSFRNQTTKNQSQQKTRAKRDTSVYYNWLEGEE
jgi:DNA replication protein